MAAMMKPKTIPKAKSAPSSGDSIREASSQKKSAPSSKSGASSPRPVAKKATAGTSKSGASSPRPVAKKSSQPSARDGRRAGEKAEVPAKAGAVMASVPGLAVIALEDDTVNARKKEKKARQLPDSQRRPVDRSPGPVDRKAGPVDRSAGPVDRSTGPVDTAVARSNNGVEGVSSVPQNAVVSIATNAVASTAEALTKNAVAGAVASVTSPRNSAEAPAKSSPVKAKGVDLGKRYAELSSRHDALAEETPLLQQEVDRLRDEVRLAEERKELSRQTMLDRLSGLVQEMEMLSEKVDNAHAEVNPNGIKFSSSNDEQDEQLNTLRHRVRAMEALVQEKSHFLEVVMAQVHASQRAQKEVARILQQNTTTLHSLNTGMKGAGTTIDRQRSDASHFDIFTPLNTLTPQNSTIRGISLTDGVGDYGRRPPSPVPGASLVNHFVTPSLSSGSMPVQNVKALVTSSAHGASWPAPTSNAVNGVSAVPPTISMGNIASGLAHMFNDPYFPGEQVEVVPARRDPGFNPYEYSTTNTSSDQNRRSPVGHQEGVPQSSTVGTAITLGARTAPMLVQSNPRLDLRQGVQAQPAVLSTVAPMVTPGKIYSQTSLH